MTETPKTPETPEAEPCIPEGLIEFLQEAGQMILNGTAEIGLLIGLGALLNL